MDLTTNVPLHTILSSCTLVHLSPEVGTLSAKRVFFWDKGRDPMRRRRGKAAAMRRFASRKFAFQPPMQLISIQFNFTQQASAANILLQKKKC